MWEVTLIHSREEQMSGNMKYKMQGTSGKGMSIFPASTSGDFSLETR